MMLRQSKTFQAALKKRMLARAGKNELQRIKEELQKAHKENQILLSAITSILIGIKSDGTINHWNRTAQNTFGLTAGKVLGQRFSDCPIPWDAGRILIEIENCKLKKRPLGLDDVAFKRKDGKNAFLGFTIIPIPDENEETWGCLLFGADITQRKETEEQLRVYTEKLHLVSQKIKQEKVQYETLLSSIGDCMVATDKKGCIVMMNQAAEEALGITAQNVIGKAFYDVISIQSISGKPLDSEKRPLDMTLSDATKTVAVAYYQGPGKDPFPAAITVSPILVKGVATGAIEIFRDITKEKKIDQMKTEFISTVSHELRTPLTGIREGVAQVLEGIFGPINEGQKEFLTVASKEIERLTTIVNDLLDISKIEAGKIELNKTWVDLQGLTRHLMDGYHSLMESKQLTLTCDIQGTDVKVFADGEKLAQVLTNLISNAYKFTEPGGNIHIQVVKHTEEVEVSVQDNGIGMEKDSLDKIFERFVQLERFDGPGMKGTGLGLPICKSLIQMHNGRIWVESEKEKGSKFIFVIPCVTDVLESDELTGVYNRRSFLRLLKQKMIFAVFKKQEMILLMVKIENLNEGLKPVEIEQHNQRLCEIAAMLRRVFKETDIIARLNKNTFAIHILETKRDIAASIIQRIEQQIKTLNDDSLFFHYSLKYGCARFISKAPHTLKGFLREAVKPLRAKTTNPKSLDKDAS